MRNTATLLIDSAITIFVVVVAVVYFGGYYFPQTFGSWTGIGMLVYLLMLLFAVVYRGLQLLGRSKSDESASQQTKKGSKRA